MSTTHTTPADPRATQQPVPTSHRFGLPTATALVVGSVIGTGVFGLPSSLAQYGPISLVAFGLATIGALALALTFGALSKRVPGSGGPYLYARDAFGDFAGFLNAWSYWITAWAGNAAIVVAWVGYVEVFWNTGHAKAWSIVIALVGLWLPAIVNLSGIRNIGVAQVVTTVLKFIPLVFMATVGLFFIKSHNFGSFNASGQSAGGAISTAPFSDSANAMFGGAWAGHVVAVSAIVSGLGALVGWTLITAEMPQAAARDKLFPTQFAQESRRGVPAFGIIVGTVLASLLTVVSYSSFDNVFTTIVLLSVFTAVVPYLFSAAAHLYWLITRGAGS